MARQESDREDLLREATALWERVEIVLNPSSAESGHPAGDEHIVAGFRRDGSASFYFGADPVYQFNSAGQLRRAFASGRLLKAERGRLVALDRQHEPHEVLLVRHELDDDETAHLLADAAARLEGLADALARQNFTLIGQVPPDADIIGRIRSWLTIHPPPIQIACLPNAS